MNIRHYILRLLLVFVCLFVLFSHSLIAYAADNEESSFLGRSATVRYDNGISTFALNEVESNSEFTYRLYGYYADGSTFEIVPWYDEDEVGGEYSWILSGTFKFHITIYFPETLPAGTVFDFNANFYKTPGTWYYYEMYASDSNGTRFYTTVDSITDNLSDYNAKYNFKGICCEESSVKSLTIAFNCTTTSDSLFKTNLLSCDLIQVTETGLLTNIIGIINNIWTSITELPSKIANSILDGLKSLFVPTEEDITEMKDKWDILLSDRFGALYQVGALISDYAAAFTEQSKGTITFPSVTIPLADAEFIFGGWEVQVVPDGFGVLFDTLKLITSILATLLFANGLKKRFDKLLGGADDI